MADVVTATYQFTLPEVGASDDTWGGKNNADWAKVETLLLSGFASGSPTDIGRLKGDHTPTELTVTGTVGLTISNNSPQLQFEELDQAMPAGRYRFIEGTDILTLQHNTHATTPYTTSEAVISVRGSGTNPKAIDIANYRLIVGATLAAGNEANVTAYGVGNHYRIKDSSAATGIATIIRSDASQFYILLTANNDADGSYSALRPFYINKTTGKAGMQQGLTLLGGLSLGSVIASSVTDLSAHIDLFGGNYGISVTSGQLNFNANASAIYVFYINGSVASRIDAIGTSAPSTQTLITREKGDFRYAMLSTSNEFKGSITVDTDGTTGFRIMNGAGVTERSFLYASGTATVLRNMGNTGSVTTQVNLEADGDFNLVTGQYVGDGSGIINLAAAAVGAAEAGLTYNSLGTISLMRCSGPFTRGDVVAASALTYSNAGGTGSTVAASGTWKAHGEASGGGGNDERTSNWRRIT